MSIWVGVSPHFEGIYCLHIQRSSRDVCSALETPPASTQHYSVIPQHPALQRHTPAPSSLRLISAVVKRDKTSELVKWRAARHGR